MASDVPGMDRSDQSPIEGEILKLPHNEGLFDAIQARGGIIQLHSPQPGAQPSINRPSNCVLLAPFVGNGSACCNETTALDTCAHLAAFS